MKHLRSLAVACLLLLLAPLAWAQCPLTAPQLTTNPWYDVIVTRTTPLLSFKNASGGQGERDYQVQLDTVETFDSKNLQKHSLGENPEGVTALQLSHEAPLLDEKRWWWRVRAVDAGGGAGPWAVSRFTVDTRSDDSFMNLVRALPESVTVSSGADPRNLVDYSDAGLATQWRATPPGNPAPWVELDLGEPQSISRIWMLADWNDPDGWPTDFHWQASNDGLTWREVQGAAVQDGDSYRFILDFPATKARFWRLAITHWQGYAAALNEILLYSPGMPDLPSPPASPYVLVVGNQHNGFTFTHLADRIRELVPELETLVVPHHEVSLAMLQELQPQPVAIVFSGNNADYNALPMFEYNGEFELIRQCKLPTLGICAGMQMHAFAYGYTRVRSMGYSDITAMQLSDEHTRINKVLDDPLLQGLPEPFTAPEVHGWAVYSLPEQYELVAESGYMQAIRRKDGKRHGVQFHPEIKADYNQAAPLLENFLRQALDN